MPVETIMVTGGTGTVGRPLVTQLLDEPGVRVRVLTRNAAAAVPVGADLHVGDFDDSCSLERAMAGCTRLFLLTSGTDITRHDVAAVAAAGRADVRHVVKLSALNVGRGGQDPITRWHRAGEEAVQASGLQWTMLRPTGFMSNALEWAHSISRTGTVSAPFPDGRTALIDPADVARVAAAVLTRPPMLGLVYDLTGPEALTPAEQVRILSDVLGRPVEYQPEDPGATSRTLAQYGMAPELALAVVGLLASAREPWNSQILPTVEQVTGRSPTTFRTWAERNKTTFTHGGRW